MKAEFTKVIPASCLTGSGLVLAPEFRGAVVPEELGTHAFELRDSAGRAFPVTITHKMQGGHKRADIHGGWRAFARESGVQAGDEMRFTWLGGRLIQAVKTGKTGVPGRTPAKAPRAARTPAKAAAAKGGKKAAATTPGSTGGVVKRRGSSSTAKKAAATPGSAGPASAGRRRRSSLGTSAAATPAAATPAAAPAEEEPQQGGGSWCAIM